MNTKIRHTLCVVLTSLHNYYSGFKGRIPVPWSIFGNLQPEVCCLERGKVEQQWVLKLTQLASALLSINFVLKLDVLLPFERVAGGIFQTANNCSELNKVTKHKLAARKPSMCML